MASKRSPHGEHLVVVDLCSGQENYEIDVFNKKTGLFGLDVASSLATPQARKQQKKVFC